MHRAAIVLLCLGCTCATARAQTTGRTPIAPTTPTPVPRRADNLNTIELASAHRERARSVEEKTSGLWQSWLVSICDGCVSLPPAKQHVQAVARRDAELASRRPSLHTEKRSAQTDLSNRSLDAIRSMPR